MENTSSKPKKQGGLFSKFAFAMGNMGHAAFYAALSNYFIIFVTSGLFVGLPKNIANKLIVLITTLIVVISVVVCRFIRYFVRDSGRVLLIF